MTKILTTFKRINKYLYALALPVALALIFVLQNQAFLSLLKIDPNQYIWRRCLVNFSLGLILYTPAVLFKKRLKYIYLFVLGSAVSLLFIAQYTYFKYSGGYLQTTAIKYMFLLPAVGGTVKTLLGWQILIFAINLIFILITLLWHYRFKLPEISLNKVQKLIAIFSVAIIGVAGYFFLIKAENKDWGNCRRLYSEMYDLNMVVSKMGIINFSLEDLGKFALRSSQITKADLDFVKTWSREQKPTQTGIKDFGLAKNRNLIFIQVESLDNAVINQKINGQEITPNLNQLAKQGLYFTNYYTQIGPGNTADAEFVTMDSLYPLPNDVVFIDFSHNQYQALPQLLKNNGYHTYVLHGDVPSFWNRSNIYPGLGYDHWFGQQDFIAPRKVGLGFADLGDEDFFKQAVPILQGLPQPFMSTLITLSSHTPFEIPQDLQTLNLDNTNNLDNTQKQYLESIHYTDRAIGKFIDQLKQAGLYDNSLIAIFGDHQSFTKIAAALGSQNELLPDLSATQVPLIILAPKTSLQGQISTPSSHLDFYPTIANLAGIKPPKDVLGQDILNTKNPVVIYRNLVSGTINSILTANLAYKSSADGIFDHGICTVLKSSKQTDPAACQGIFNQQADIVRASDIIVRANLLKILSLK